MDQPPQLVAQQLARHMGHNGTRSTSTSQPKRDIAAKRAESIYDFMQDLREANLLRCLSPDVTLDTSYYLYEKSLPHLASGKRIVELACWTGGLSSFIAENHPDCTVVGVDRVPRILELNQAHYGLPNLTFTRWDYRQAKPDELEPADLLLCGLGTNNDCPPGAYTPRDPVTVRTLPATNRKNRRRRATSRIGVWLPTTMPFC